MTKLKSRLAQLPYAQYRKNRYFYPLYDGIYFVATTSLLAAMHFLHWQSSVQHWSWSLLLWLPLVCYAQILSAVFIHVCTHKSLPIWINRAVGELCGLVVLTRFASWEIIHQRHHQFSDDRELDPHPLVPGFFAFVVKTTIGVEKQLQKIFFELHGGATDNNLRFEKRRAWFSYATNVLLIATWWRFLGTALFVEIFVPATVIGSLYVYHFNWSTHNGEAGKDFHPVNLNQGRYWVGNKLFFGIYMHKNHHHRPSVFNPATIIATEELSAFVRAA